MFLLSVSYFSRLSRLPEMIKTFCHHHEVLWQLLAMPGHLIIWSQQIRYQVLSPILAYCFVQACWANVAIYSHFLLFVLTIFVWFVSYCYVIEVLCAGKDLIDSLSYQWISKIKCRYHTLSMKDLFKLTCESIDRDWWLRSMESLADSSVEFIVADGAPENWFTIHDWLGVH